MNFIKNKILSLVVIILVMIIVIMFVVAINNFHSRVAMVTEINEIDGLITATCGNGNMFSFYSTNDDWHCGDLCGLIMFDSGTDIVYDDIVVKARYEGYVELFEEIENTID